MRLFLGTFLLCPVALLAQIRSDSLAVAARAPISLPWIRFAEDVDGPARPAGYVSAVGRRAALIGSETGSFEVWTWPLKLLHGFDLAFKTPLADQLIEGRDLARRVEVSPAGVTIVYTHPAFTVTERLFVPLHEPAVVVVLEVDAVRPLEIVARFRPDLQYAWPGAMGGQYVYWDDRERAFGLSESRRSVNGFFGSPNATWATNNPSHMLADAASELHIAVGDQGGAPVPMPRPGEPAGRLTEVHDPGIPIVMVGAVAPRDSVRAIYRRVLGHVAELYGERAAHARAVLDSTVVIDSPDEELDRAVRWAAVNLDDAMVCNPDLGCGLVAGYGPSGATSTRPGFAWFFGGDAAINSLAMSSAGLWTVARDGLAFFAGYQGTKPPNAGKIPHEISQAAAHIGWFDDYPYAFYHGDTTPFWMLALAEYWRASGDTGTIRRLWPNLKRAFDWARGTDADGDGLMDNARAGAGAIEVGDLQQGLRSDIYMSAVWVRALETFPALADLMGDRAAAAQARRLRAQALATLRDKFWIPTARRYAFALLDGDSLSDELTVWPATGLAFGLFDDARGVATATSLARAAITTDWGARSLASTSPLFDPLHYNNGTVWPFVTGFDALGLFRYHNATMGFAALAAVAHTTFLWGLGDNPEVFSGSSFEPLETAVPQQFFATSMLLTPLIRGLVGWDADVPADRVTLAPHLPPVWDSLTVARLPAGTGRYRVRFERDDSTFVTELHRTAGRGVDTLRFGPALPLGAQVRDVRVNGRPLACTARDTGADVHLDCTMPLTDSMTITVRHTPGWDVLLPPPAPARGSRSSALKLLAQRLAGDTLLLDLEGPAGHSYRVTVRTPVGLREAPVTFPTPGDRVDGYSEAVVRVSAQP